MRRTYLFASALIFSVAVALSVSAHATDKAPAPPVKSEQALKLEKKAADIAAHFTPTERESLGVISDGFGIMHAVMLTNKSVSTTIAACGKRNPEMKADMDAAYTKWYGGIGPVLEAREKDLKAAVRDGRFSKPQEVEAFLDALDSLARHNYDRMEKSPLTTPSACERLVKSMERSGEKLSKALTELKFPYAVAKEKAATDAADKKGGRPN